MSRPTSDTSSDKSLTPSVAPGAAPSISQEREAQASDIRTKVSENTSPENIAEDRFKDVLRHGSQEEIAQMHAQLGGGINLKPLIGEAFLEGLRKADIGMVDNIIFALGGIKAFKHFPGAKEALEEGAKQGPGKLRRSALRHWFHVRARQLFTDEEQMIFPKTI